MGRPAKMAWGNTGLYNDASNFMSCKCQHDSLCYADGRTTNAELARPRVCIMKMALEIVANSISSFELNSSRIIGRVFN